MTLATIALGQRMQTEDSQAILQRRLLIAAFANAECHNDAETSASPKCVP